jgi:hypothetical protein
MKHGFTGAPQSEKGTPLLGNIPIHPLQKKNKNSSICEKTMVSVFWDCEALLPPGQQSTVTNTVKLSKNCVRPLNKRYQDN